MKVYIAAGWFSPEQEARRIDLLRLAQAAPMDYYSPKDKMLYKPGDDPNEIFEENIRQITKCDGVLASTEGKDLGTVFECGVAYMLNKPVVYWWPRKETLNLMLSSSAVFIGTSFDETVRYLKACIQLNRFFKVPYDGGVE